MDTPVEISNYALVAYLGKPTISSFTEDSVEARRCAFLYPYAMSDIARASHWSFLREQAALAGVTNDRPDAWSFCYDLPSRALKIFSLADPALPDTPYRHYHISNGVVYANLPEARANYTTLEDRPLAAMSSEFKSAVAAKLAELLAPTMTRRSSDVERMRTLSQMELSKAIERDAAQEHTTYTKDEEYVYGREATIKSPVLQADGSTMWE